MPIVLRGTLSWLLSHILPEGRVATSRFNQHIEVMCQLSACRPRVRRLLLTVAVTAVDCTTLLHHETVHTPSIDPKQKSNQTEHSASSYSTLISDGTQAHAASMDLTTVLGAARILLQSFSSESIQFRALVDPDS